MSERFICIHGHFYQPPRENPWLEKVEFQDSAQPYHDWNERITAECYAPNAVSRVMDSQWRIIGLINNYSRISFNFGPTLLYWLERNKPEVYESVLYADKESINNYSGHGSAIAQVYNHMIMPLANKRDKQTQVKWAIIDFQTRFKREPEGMWLPETAVDIETLEVLAENHIKFTILGPHQAIKIRKIGEENWVDVTDGNGNGKVDPRRVYLCNLPSGRTINLFFYDKRTASDIAFGNLLENGEAFAKRLIGSFENQGNEGLIENIASDGELYGHHHPHGDMTLAYCIYYIVSHEEVKLTNYSEFLANNSPQFEVEIKVNSSWSCMHGVERWRSDCGDNMGKKGWHQAWRKPLREAMDWLRDSLSEPFEKEASQYLIDPWNARDDYINVILNRAPENLENFIAKHSKRPLNDQEKKRAIKLLEMQRHAMLMFTSCGWFFDEISGIETVQVMMYAARAMQLAQELFKLDLEGKYLQILEKAPSNIPEFENGAKVYAIFVKPAVVDFTRLSAQNTMMQLFGNHIQSSITHPDVNNCCFTVSSKNNETIDDGKFRLTLNMTKVHSAITLDEETFGCAAIWLGDHNVSCGARQNMLPSAFTSMRDQAIGSFERGQINEIIVLLSKYFEHNIFSLKDMFRDDQRLILDYIIADGLKKAKDLYDIIYLDNSAMLRFMQETRVPSPKPLRSAAEVVLNMEIEQLLTAETPDLEKLRKAIADSKRLSITLDSELLAYKASEKVSNEFIQLSKDPENLEEINLINRLIELLNELPINPNYWQAQNITFKIAENQYKQFKQKTDDTSKAWIMAFTHLSESIGIRLESM